jgi:hypothetical protein
MPGSDAFRMQVSSLLGANVECTKVGCGPCVCPARFFRSASIDGGRETGPTSPFGPKRTSSRPTTPRGWPNWVYYFDIEIV